MTSCERECLSCGGLMHNGGNSGRVSCWPCWLAFLGQHPGGHATRRDLLNVLFEQHWAGKQPGLCAECARPLRSRPYLWKPGRRCMSCRSSRGNSGRVTTTDQARALREGRKVRAAA